MRLKSVQEILQGMQGGHADFTTHAGSREINTQRIKKKCKKHVMFWNGYCVCCFFCKERLTLW